MYGREQRSSLSSLDFRFPDSYPEIPLYLNESELIVWPDQIIRRNQGSETKLIQDY